MTSRCSDKRIEHDQELSSSAPRPKIAKSKAAKWRVLALITVHALVAIHIAHWWSKGSTMSPLEPSESMEFSKKGIVNAGFIFFALTIGSTLVLGRWFCGWACHVVALQDGCRWILIKLGIRPRMVNLGILGVVPWLAFVYMFLAPLVQRVLLGELPGVRATHLYTDAFWATFPNVFTTVLTFVVCGGAIVYFLGSKGFCNYGCPYGAIFGVVDQLAPMRIRVTDACEGCGHCTAVCTSNVKVHQEVRDHGMVVDPGCMKCMDCVSVCPKEALYFGGGMPALFAPARTSDALAARKSGRAAQRAAAAPSNARAALIGGWLLLIAFVPAALALFMSYDGAFPTRLLIVLSIGSLAVALVFRGKARRAREYSLAEEALLASFFLGAMYVFRGLYHSVPFLFALGLSAILAYVAVQGVRLLYARHVSIQQLRLRVAGSVTRGGIAFAAVLLPIGWFWWSQGWTRYQAAADAHAAHASYEQGVQAVLANDFESARGAFERSLALDPTNLDARANLAGMLCATGRFREGAQQFEAVLARHPDDAEVHVLAARAYLELHDDVNARAHLERTLVLAPTHAQAQTLLTELRARQGDSDGRQH